ncbi:MAG: ATP-dependent Clp protease ATP-binding subunit [Myxococcales bacterium]|nr:ATP-dependent Clp protease ATP-binding subunit [Myxococcales bacterium]MCB9532254.1 ATP-dependent Clp protease ATP-binding subunit [Myxococcales bacterium]MCB9533918.1 ATP-dependent Clp protease ATP-binding subunit [Myxococcales bacterium]
MTGQPSESLDLFLPDGALNRQRLTADAAAVMDACSEWLVSVERSVFLPIDLLTVLLMRGHSELERVVASGRVGDSDVVESLKSLARRVDREGLGEPRLHVDQFSLGFTGILTDALQWARESGRARVSEADLVRVMRWRAELQESASVRWALKQLQQQGGELLFEPDGELRRSTFSSPAWSTLQEAMRLSARSGLAFLGTPHLMAALAARPGLLAEACEGAAVRPMRLHDDLLAIVGERRPVQADFPLSRQTLTPRLVRMLLAAARSAESRAGVIGEAELLDAFVEDGGSSLDLATALGVTDPLRRILGDESRRAGSRRVSVFEPSRVGSRTAPGSSATPTLDELGRDLTAEARAGRLSPVLGRDTELQSVINVLMRSEQRNPLLTGSAGVGKTALANALAQRIADGTVPARLASMRVVEINGAALVGGTSYRGELEARIQALLVECERDVVLFIDEAHAVFAPRSSSGQPAEIPNHFKAALASGKIAVIAATTEAEFRRWIEEDPALRRRFERIRVEELSAEQTRSILVALAPRYEREYDVPVTPDAVDAAIELSVRFMPEQALPDKAKKLLMDATIAVASEVALSRRRGGSASGGEEGTPSKRVVTRADVARLVAAKTGAPLDRVQRGAIAWWTGLEERLARHVIGQDRAVHEVTHSLVAGRLTAAGRRRPQAVLAFVGPPAVGMAELARGLAIEVFGSESALLTLEMGDFAEAHALARLIGSPPGYVGYQDEDALVTPLRRTPSRVVLLQDFGKAHARIQERLFRVFEDGELSDTRGLRADVSHAIFVLTVEVEPQAATRIGFGRSTPSANDALRQADSELAARLKGRDIEVVVFDGLSERDGELSERLLRHRLGAFRESLEHEYDIELVIGADVDDELVRRARALDDARGLEAIFRELVVEPVTRMILEGNAGPTLTLGAPPERPRRRVESANLSSLSPPGEGDPESTHGPEHEPEPA